MAAWYKPFGPGYYETRIGERHYRVYMAGISGWNGVEISRPDKEPRFIKSNLPTAKAAKKACEEDGELI